MHEEIQQAAAGVDSVETFRLWLRQSVAKILPHGAMACGHGRIHAAGISTDYILTADYPVIHLKEICNPAGGIDTPLMRRWLATREPVLFDPTLHADWPEISPGWLNHFLKNDLRNAAVHAVLDSERFVGTYFSFHQLNQSPDASVGAIMKDLIPVLHETLMRVVGRLESTEKIQRPPWESLTPKELEVATWIGLGRTTADIALLLEQSQNTVKHHTSHILKKLHFANRAELAAALVQWPPGMVSRGTRVL